MLHFYEISKNGFSAEHFQTIASEQLIYTM